VTSKRLSRAALLTAISLPLVGGAFLHQHRKTVEQAKLFDQVFQLVSTRYIDTISTDTLYKTAAQGLIRELHDPFSSFYSRSEFTQFNNAMRSNYVGLGIQIAAGPTGIIVQHVFPHTPASENGVIDGDQITQVDTFSTYGWTAQEISDKIHGPSGTPITLTLQRPGVPKPIVVALERSVVHIPTVPYAFVLEGTIGYIPLLQFGERASLELANAVANVTEQGATSLILDLRGDPGGLLQQAVDVSSLFLPEGTTVVTLHDRHGRTAYNVSTTPVQPDIPIVILVDGHTASASEIVTGALQDHDRALVIGTPTFGKGVAQELFQLEDGYTLRLTTARWYTPNGRLIHRDRTLLDNGRVVELDSASDNMADRPVFSSDSGRTLYGGGGIVPDLIVTPDTPTSDERELLQSIAPWQQVYTAQMQAYAFTLRGKLKPSFTFTPQMRATFVQQLRDHGVVVDDSLLAHGGTALDRAVGKRITTILFGDSTAEHKYLGHDRQLQQAINLLENSQDQPTLFTMAQHLTDHH
jgi:carboxyl-terminal processing protease